MYADESISLSIEVVCYKDEMVCDSVGCKKSIDGRMTIADS